MTENIYSSLHVHILKNSLFKIGTHFPIIYTTAYYALYFAL